MTIPPLTRRLIAIALICVALAACHRPLPKPGKPTAPVEQGRRHAPALPHNQAPTTNSLPNHSYAAKWHAHETAT